ncbi:MAG: guanylate kinase [Bacteroidota bacterium]
MSKLLIFTAPSGAGKTTIVRHLLNKFDNLAFSVSATTRPPRFNEVDGKDYYFLSPEKFIECINRDEFVEWEEVYTNRFYGTLKSEIERLWQKELNIVFDIDVYGALNIKKCYPKESLAIFVKPPTKEILFNRLKNRKTEKQADLEKRIQKAEEELSFENKFDIILVNDVLIQTLEKAEEIVTAFINS